MNYNNLLVQAEMYIYQENPDLNKALECILDFIKKTDNLYPNDKQIFSFNNTLEYIMFFNKTKFKKEHTYVSILYHRAHRLLGKIYLKQNNLDKAKEEYIKALEYNPMDMRTHFYIAELEKIKGDLENFRKTNYFLYNDIYEPKALAKFYRNLGIYYKNKNNLELAYNLFKYSLNYDVNEEAKKELALIGIIDKTTSLEEMFKQNQIPLSISKENIQLLKGILKNNQINDEQMKNLIEYYLSYFDKEYQSSRKNITIKNPDANFSVQVSSEWAIVDPSQYEKLGIDLKTKYFFYFDDTKINIIDLGTADLDLVYNQNKQLFTSQNMEILKEGQAVKNRREIKFAFLRTDTEYIFETYFKVGNHVIGASTVLDHGFFMNDKNVLRLWDIINTIKEA